MKNRLLIFATIVGIAAVAPGCITAATETYGGITGAKGLFSPLDPRASSPDLLAGYTRFELRPLADDFAGRVPPDFLSYMPSEFDKALAKKKLPNSTEGKTAFIRGRIVYYEDQRFVGVVIGPIEEVVARVELVDQKSGRVLSTAMCVGRSTTRTTIGVEHKAQGLARALAAWISANYPTAGREKAEED